jgi:dTDP-4-dehydrorhamnose reductase
MPGVMNVVVFGAAGMLGSMVLRSLSAEPTVTLTATVRDAACVPQLQAWCPSVAWSSLDSERATVEDLITVLSRATWAVNAIGVVKSHIHDDVPSEVERATRVNGLFPHLLAKAAAVTGTRVIQIATDCVYSGSRGQYREADAHDAIDVYGKTKSLGEAAHASLLHLRCSIVGPELRTHKSLLDWFVRQPRGAVVRGFTNHHWNGVTTLHFARLCRAIMLEQTGVMGRQHVIPGNAVTKADLLESFARAFGRTDVSIVPGPAATPVDRTLATSHPEVNQRLWTAAGYPTLPTIDQMVDELAVATREWPSLS